MKTSLLTQLFRCGLLVAVLNGTPAVGRAATLEACGYHDLNLVMEQLPSDWTPWYTRNNDSMWLWNQYMDIYRFSANDGGWGRNSENEFGGWPSNADLNSTWGFNWGSALAMTVFRWNCTCCEIIESDVVFNPAFTWTADRDVAEDNPASYLYYDSILLHEMGHNWGMQTRNEDYNYSQPTVMHSYNRYSVQDRMTIHYPEAYLIRRQYDDQKSIPSLSNFMVVSKYANGSWANSWTDKSTYYQGEAITVNNLTVENTGTTTLSNPHIRLYLSSNRTISTADTQLGDWNWGSFGAESYGVYDFSTTIPSSIAPGQYYVGALVTINGYSGDDLSHDDSTRLWDRITVNAKVPTGVAASDGTYTGYVRVTWSAVSGAPYYRVYRATSSGGTKTAVSSWQTSTSFDDTSATPGVTYYYFVRAALNSSGSYVSGYSAYNTGWRALSAPGGVAATDGTSTAHVRVTWSSVSGASHYRVYRATSSAGTKTALGAWQTGTSYDDTGATPGVTYYYFVSAATSSTGTRASAYSAYNTGWRALTAPTGVAASDGTYTSHVRVTWNSVTGASHYRVYRATSSGGTKTALGSWQTGTSYDDTGVTPGVTYYYFVSAATSTTGTRASAYSAYNTGWRALAIPVGIAASDGTYPDKVRANWSAVSGASHYRVSRAETLGGAKTTISGWIAATDFDDTTGLPGITYYYSVQSAISSTGTRASDYSAEDPGYRSAAPPCSEEAWVTSFVPGTLRNDAGGWRGMRLRTGGSPVTVTALGRVYVNGNGRSHRLTLVEASSGTTVATAEWTPAGGVHNQIKYVSLATPVVLAADTGYFLASLEEAGGDSWYSYDTAVSTTGVATAVTAVYNTSGSWVSFGPAGSYSYVPVALRYCAEEPCSEADLLTSFVPGTLRNDVGGWRGMRLRTGGGPVTVTALGRVYVNGNSRNHQLALVEASSGTAVATAEWTPAGGVHNQIKYVSLAAPALLAANTDYYLASLEEAGGDSWYSYNTAVSTTGVATALTAVYNTSGSWVAYGPAGSYSYVPVALRYCSEEPCSEADLLTSFVPGTLRNDVGGWRGMRLRTGGSPVTVTALGRVYVNGNSRNHQLALVEASSGTAVATAEWTPAGGVHNQIKYVSLAAPALLAANTDYYLASLEEAGGDSWYSYNTAVSTTGVATALTAVYNTSGSWVAYGPAGSYSYVPVGLRYCQAGPCQETRWVTSFTAGTVRNDVGGWRGMRFQTGASPVTVTALGRVLLAGNVHDHQVALVEASSGTVLATALWTPAGGVHNQISYVALAAPVTLAANSQYYVASLEVAGQDSWYSYNTPVVTTAAAAAETAVYSNNGTTWVPYGASGSYSYVPVGFIYCGP
jgi:fibronectin type 3 domain-containing protein